MTSMATTSMTTVELEERDGVLYLYLNRPQARNALDPKMIEELTAVAASLADREDIRCVVMRGRGSFFSAGGDLRGLGGRSADIALLSEGESRSEAEEAVARHHRRFGTLLELLDALPQALLVVVEGAALGGGFGLLTVADVVLARSEARLGMPEARLGLVPAQIAPFVVRRIGLAASRRLLVTGRPIDGRRGMEMGLVDFCCEAEADLEADLAKTLRDVLRCGPQAIAAGKALLQAAAVGERPAVLDEGARVFARRLRSEEGQEGLAAFLEDRHPAWAREG